MKDTLFFLCFVSLCATLRAQPGCTDPQADNFNPLAQTNDGSCTYPLTAYQPALVCNLPASLSEISGIVRADGRWWVHNDGGNGRFFYGVNASTGAVLQTVKVDNGNNEDWEDIAATSTAVYIGDFGNNFNDRKDLGIYKIPIKDIGNDAEETVKDDEWTFIPFQYADQTDFSTQKEEDTEFDCEAMICRGGKLHLFTKNRKKNISSHYIINEITGKAELLESFDTQGLVTAADITPDGKVIALAGYDLSSYRAFCWLLWDFQGDQFFGGNKRRIDLGSVLTTGQVEALGFLSNRAGLIGSEALLFNGVVLQPQALRSFDFSEWLPPLTGTESPLTDRVRLSPNPFVETVELRHNQNEKPEFVRVFDAGGRCVKTDFSGETDLDLSALPAGAYTLCAQYEEGVARLKAIKL